MRKEYKHTSEEAAEREKRHQFGQPNGNPRGDGAAAANQREFYRWCESVATMGELKAYSKDETKPYARRKFVMALTACDKVQDFFDLTNQTHGQPKQVVEQTQLPEVRIIVED